MTTEIRRAPAPRPLQNGDMWMTPEEVCQMLRCTMNRLYKMNAGDGPAYSRIGKRCLYLYSEVQNWMLDHDTRIKDKPKLHSKRPIDQLPRTWPPEVWPMEPMPDKPPRKRGERKSKDVGPPGD